jgi:hypothetical protein
MRAILSGVLGRIPRPTPAMGVALLALLIAASGAAVAAIPHSVDGTITACYNTRTGALRVINAEGGQTCGSRQTQLEWKDGITGKVADSDLLDGQDSTDLLPGGDLPAGTTLRGHYDIFGNTTGQNDNTLGADAISFVYTLSSEPQKTFIPAGTTSPPECPGSPGSPEAQPGHLCVYEQNRENIATGWPTFYVQSTYGFGIWAAAANEGHARSFGTWAVTNAGGGASASATAGPSASATAAVQKVPDSGGGVGTWVALPAALALMGCGIGAMLLMRRRFT